MKNEFTTEIMNSVDEIADAEITAEASVVTAMLDSYSKALTILENYKGENLSDFTIFQESFIQEADGGLKEGETEFRKFKEGTTDKESIIISILKFIPRVFQMIYNAITKKIDTKKTETVKKNSKTIEKMPPEEKKNMIKNVGNFFKSHGKEIAIGTGVLTLAAGATMGGIMVYKSKKGDKTIAVDIEAGTVKTDYDIGEMKAFVGLVKEDLPKEDANIPAFISKIKEFVSRHTAKSKKIAEMKNYTLTEFTNAAAEFVNASSLLSSISEKAATWTSNDVKVNTISPETAKDFAATVNDMQSIVMGTVDTTSEYLNAIKAATDLGIKCAKPGAVQNPYQVKLTDEPKGVPTKDQKAKDQTKTEGD